MKKIQNTLSKVNALGIKTREALSLNAQLYADLFTNIDQFITTTVFRSHSNINKLMEQKKLGVDIEDIRMDCIKKIISNLDYFLAKELSAQIPLIYQTCNRIIIDSYRKAIKESGFIVPLEDTLNFHETNENSKKSKSLIDCLMDTKASPETKYIAKASIIELYQKHCHNADNLLCILATKVFQDKPSEVASLLIKEGSVDKALAAYEDGMSELYGISKSELPNVASAKATGLSKLLSKSDLSSRKVSGKISNILNRTK